VWLTEEDVKEIARQLPAADPVEPWTSADTEHLSRTAAAALGLQRALPRSDVQLPGRTWLVTFGFIPLSPGLAEQMGRSFPRSNQFTFGVSVFEHGAGDAMPNGRTQRVVSELVVNEKLFPVVVTTSRFTRHAPPSVDATSTKGSCACWISYSGSATPAPWTNGLFTARHVVEHLTCGDQVTLDAAGSPYLGTVADYGACTVDAAVIEVDQNDWPSGLAKVSSPARYKTPIAPGLSVGLTGRMTSSRLAGAVVSHHPLPGYWGSMMGQRVVVDITGSAGDSGGWTDAPNGDGVGIYMGEIDDGTGGKYGLAQDLYQACVYLEADIYQ
jgi:hypothetical protein